jgi:hypothetical protein
MPALLYALAMVCGPGFQVIGHWKSRDGKLYYYAVGGILDASGKLLSDGTR